MNNRMAHAVIIGCRFTEAVGRTSDSANLLPQEGQNEACSLTPLPQVGQNGMALPPDYVVSTIEKSNSIHLVPTYHMGTSQSCQ